jgi:hypothetical protein
MRFQNLIVKPIIMTMQRCPRWLEDIHTQKNEKCVRSKRKIPKSSNYILILEVGTFKEPWFFVMKNLKYLNMFRWCDFQISQKGSMQVIT